MNIIVLELILVLVVALGLGFWQLYDVNKALKKHQDNNDGERSHRDRSEAAEPERECGRHEPPD